MKLRYLLVVCSLVGGLGGGSLVAQAQGLMPEFVVNTASYQMILRIGPAESVVSQNQADAGMMGDVLANPGSGMSTARATAGLSQNAAPNHHIEVQINRKGAVTTTGDLTPSILVMNQATGEIVRFDNVPAMFTSNMGGSDLHYGVNASIPDGLYTITVLVNNEKATFSDILITGGGRATVPVAPSVAATITGGPDQPFAPTLPIGTDATVDFSNQTSQAQTMLVDAFRNLQR